MKIFYAITVKDTFLRAYLDLIRFVANSSEKRTTHITVRGPYTQKQTLTACNRKISDKPIFVYGIGNFFKFHQTTVFLTCDAPELRQIWHKKGFDYNPHITLYDGNSSYLAESIFSLFSQYKIDFGFRSSELVPVVVKKGQTNLDLSLVVDTDLLNRFCKLSLKVDTIRNLTDSGRLSVITDLLTYLPNINTYFHSDKDENEKQ